MYLGITITNSGSVHQANEGGWECKTVSKASESFEIIELALWSFPEMHISQRSSLDLKN